MSQALRKLTSTVNKTKCIIVFINQIREKIGVMYGNNETTTGGRALKFYASVRLDVRRSEFLKGSGELVGNRVKDKVLKNKVAPSFKEAYFDIMFGIGISKASDILDLAVENDIVDKSGAWFAYEAEKIGQGRDNAKLYLENHPEMMAKIKEKVRDAYGLINSNRKTVNPRQEEENETRPVEESSTSENDPYLAELEKKKKESA